MRTEKAAPGVRGRASRALHAADPGLLPSGPHGLKCKPQSHRQTPWGASYLPAAPAGTRHVLHPQARTPTPAVRCPPRRPAAGGAQAQTTHPVSLPLHQEGPGAGSPGSPAENEEPGSPRPERPGLRSTPCPRGQASSCASPFPSKCTSPAGAGHPALRCAATGFLVTGFVITTSPRKSL